MKTRTTAVTPIKLVESDVSVAHICKYDVNELLFKILVIGDYGVGKTAIIRRYTKDEFSLKYKLTIGVDFAIKSIEWDETTHVTVQLWDIAGHERFGYMTHVYYKYAMGAIIVFDLSRPATLNSVVQWQKDVNDKVTFQNGQPIPIVLVANKCDIEGVVVECAVLSEFCKKHNIPAWLFTSAKENINIKEAVDFLIDRIIHLRDENARGLEVPDGQAWAIKLTDKPVSPKKSKCCGG